MNLREGTRRLALLLGVVGAILGGFASFVELQSIQNQNASYNKFLALANSDAAQQERKILKADAVGNSLPPWAIWGTKVNRGGIATIYWNDSFRIAEIETLDGQALFPTPSPAAWMYLLIALLPVLGFIIPWGAIRAIGWVGSGFAEK